MRSECWSYIRYQHKCSELWLGFKDWDTQIFSYETFFHCNIVKDHYGWILFVWLEAEVALLISTLGVINETKRIQADASYILFVTSMNNGMT